MDNSTSNSVPTVHTTTTRTTEPETIEQWLRGVAKSWEDTAVEKIKTNANMGARCFAQAKIYEAIADKAQRENWIRGT